MSHCSNNNSPNKPPRFTTTAIINCSAYPPDTSTQKRIITQTKSLEDEISSSCAGKSSSSANGHVKSSQFTDHTFPRKVSVGESATEAERVTLKKPFGGVPSAPPPPPSLPKSVPSNGESASTHPRLFPNSRFAQTTNSLPRGYSPKFSGASNMSNASTLRSAGTGNSFGVGVGHKVVVPGSSSEAPQKVNNAPKNLGFGASNASGIAKNGGFNSGTNATNNFKIATNSNIKSGVNNSNSNSNNKPKADPNDPQVRRLVYNMYRGLLDNKHAHSNNIIDSKPSLQVDTDEGVKNRVLSMMKQQEELKAGKTSTMNGPAGPPPPPPPPPFVVPGATPPPVVQAPPMTSRAAPRPGPPQVPLVAPPAALAGAMMKDKKPFTYTPGGLDLSEIRSPRMQRRLSRNAALEGVKPSPLAQPQQVSSPGIPSPAASSGIAVQVLPMPGMSMAKAPSTPPPSAKTKEPPPIKKNVCGPAPPPPPFAVGVNGALGNNVPTSTPVQTPTKVPVSPVSPVTQTSMQGDGVLNTPSSPPFSSQSSDPRSPSPSLVSTESGGSNAIPAPPPMPPQCATARRASLVKSENQALPGAEAQTSASERLNNAENISPAFSATTDSNRSVGSSSMAVEDETTSYREDSVTPSHASNHEKASVDNQYSSNESLLKQISALEQITARHQSKSDHVSSSKENVNKNATLEPDVPVQPILRLSTKPKISEAEERSKREAEEKAKMEEEQRRREEQARLEAQEKEKERIKKEKEQERIRQEKEQERIRQEKEQERIKKEKEQERIRQEEEKERIRHEKEKERIRQEKEKMEEECRRQEEARVKEENERLLKIELENKKKMEEEQRKQQALEKQRIEEARKQKEELQRLEEERQRTREIEIQKQRDIEWKKQEEEWRKLRELEIQQQRELESHKFDDEARSTSQKLDFSPGGESGVSNQANVAKNRRLRQGSVPVQLRGSALSNTPASQRHSTLEAQQTTREMERNDTESPNISPTTGLVRVPLPWMSAVPRRETSAPPEFVNYAQGTQTRLQQQHLQRAQRQQSQDYSKVPSGPSPVFKEAVVSSPPVVYQHPGGSNIKLGDSGRSTLPRQHKPNVEKTLSGGPALRPWAVKHQEYQQQKLAQGGNPTVDVNRARYHQRDGQQGYSYGQAVQTPPSSGGGSRWPEVQPPSFLRQSSTDAPAVKNPPSTGAKVRIVPIVMEQDSSSETEQAYGSADSSTPTYVFNSGNRTVNPQSVGRFTGSTLPKNPPHPQGQSPISPPSSKWSPNQPQFKVVRPGQPATAGVQKPQSSPVYYNNPIGMYSEGNAVEALQQMQQSLAQLNSGLQNAYPKFIHEKMSNSLPTRNVDSPAPAPDTTPVQSRSFRVLQQVVDSEVSGSDDEIRGFMSQDEGPISYQTAQSKTFTGGPKGRGPRLNNSVQSPLARQNYPEPFGREPQAVDNGPKGTLQQQQQQPRGFGNNSNAIPSRAFRALQQQTGNGDAAAPHPSASSCHPSLSSSSSISFHPSSHPSPSSVNFNIGNKSADNPGARPENHPEQTGKNTGSQIIVNSGIKPKNVNSALSKNREASPSRWQVNTSNVTHNETPRASSPLVEEQSRLLKFIGEEAAENANKSGTPTMEPKKLYGGAKIPSRVFKHLQTEFSNTSTSTQPGARHARENSSPVGGDKPQLSAGLLRLLQSDQDKLQQDQRDGKGSSVSSSRGNINEYYSNGVANTAARKESVLRELTTQFDPSTECRKPKAAPGKVFRYLQQHYDNTDDSSASQPINNADIGKKSGLSTYISDTEHQPKSSRFHSPSFSVLLNQYRNEEASPSNGLKSVTRRISLEKPSDSDPHDLTSLRITEEGDLPQSKPYVGKRVPGKTFRMLQENYANHPSVLQARK